MPAPMPNSSPPNIAVTVSCQPASPVAVCGSSRKTGIVIANTHSADFTMLREHVAGAGMGEFGDRAHRADAGAMRGEAENGGQDAGDDQVEHGWYRTPRDVCDADDHASCELSGETVLARKHDVARSGDGRVEARWRVNSLSGIWQG